MSLITPKKFLFIPEYGVATKCVICGAECLPAGRMNVLGKGKVNLKSEIEALDIGIVLPTTGPLFVCKSKCYGELLKHHNCREKLKGIKQNFEVAIQSSGNIRMKRMSKEDTGPPRAHGEKTQRCLFSNDHDASPGTPSPITSTPRKAKPSVLPATGTSTATSSNSFCYPFVVPIQPIAILTNQPSSSSAPVSSSHTVPCNNRADNEKEQDVPTSVQVSIMYKSTTKDKQLPQDLEPIGKALVRGTYGQIASAAFKSTKLKQAIIKVVLNSLAKECSELCARKNPSCLRNSKSREDIMDFSMEKLCAELCERAPILYSFLMTAASNPSRQDRLDREWLPSVGMAGSILLKSRNCHMSAGASLVSVIIRHSAMQNTFSRLNAMKVSLSNHRTLVKLDQYGLKYDEPVKTFTTSECSRLQEMAQLHQKLQDLKTITAPDPHDEQQSTVGMEEFRIDKKIKSLSTEAHPGAAIVLDNIDIHQHTHQMTSDNQDPDHHWVNHMAVFNRVSGNYLNDDGPQHNILDVRNIEFLPSIGEHKEQRRNFITLISRVLVDCIPALSFLKTVCERHISHPYKAEMSQKSEKVPMGVLFKNENKTDEMVSILRDVHKSIPFSEKNEKKHFHGMPVVGDQLTVERGVYAIQAVQNSYTDEGQLKGLYPAIADWHTAVKFLQLFYDRHFSGRSDIDRATMFADRNIINRRNVRSDVHNAWAPCRSFAVLEIDARIIAAGMKVLEMESINANPSRKKLPTSIAGASNVIKKLYLDRIAAEVVDSFVVDMNKFNAFVSSMFTEQERQDYIDNQPLTPDGRFPCRFTGCDKSFKHDGKRRRAHELLHDPPPCVPHSSPLTSVSPTTNEPEETAGQHDDMFNYNCSILVQGLLFKNFLDAISEGDGERSIRCWKFMLLYFKEDGSGSVKYALEGLYLLMQVKALLSPREAHRLMWNRSVNNKGVVGGNVALDLDLEHENNYMKNAIRNLGPNLTKQAVTRIARAQNITKQLIDKFDAETGLRKRSGRHTVASQEKDLMAIVQIIVEEDVFTETLGRTYHAFPEFQRDPLASLDLSDVYKWINTHKRNMSLSIKPR